MKFQQHVARPVQPDKTPIEDARPMTGVREEIVPLTIRFGRVRWKVRSSATVASVQHVLREPNAFLADKNSLLKNTSRVTIGRIHSSVSEHEGWILRRTNYGSTLTVVRDCLRVSGPMRAFRAGLELERAGIPTPRVCAAGIARVFHKPVVGYLLVEEITPSLTLVECFRQRGHLPRRAVRRVAEVIAHMHKQGFMHGDLTINNILLDEDAEPWLIDLERVKFRGRPVKWHEAVEDFYRFARHVERLGPAARRAGLQLAKYYCQIRSWRGREREFATAVLVRLTQKLARS